MLPTLLDDLWIHVAMAVNLSIRRSDEVFASYNGQGALIIGVPETLDEDDSLAQLVFHELCHWITEGSASFCLADWGLTQSDHLREKHCIFLQSLLVFHWGGSAYLHPTTEYRFLYGEALRALCASAASPGFDSLTVRKGPQRKMLRGSFARLVASHGVEVDALARSFERAMDFPWNNSVVHGLMTTESLLQLYGERLGPDWKSHPLREPWNGGHFRPWPLDFDE